MKRIKLFLAYIDYYFYKFSAALVIREEKYERHLKYLEIKKKKIERIKSEKC